ncbi:MAG: hypothetical protein ACJA04_001121 [Cellvibrionaceae bacterium]|jgi:hypothetical protein
MNDNTININDEKDSKNEKTTSKTEAVVEVEVAESHTEPKLEKTWKENVLSSETWLRFVFMVLFFAIFYIACFVIVTVIILQFIWTSFTGKNNERLRILGGSLSQYIYQVLCFLTYKTSEKPFPFADWPDNQQ